jgi:hypothetical protein
MGCRQELPPRDALRSGDVAPRQEPPVAEILDDPKNSVYVEA